MQYLEISRYENFSWILSFNNTIQFLELYMTKIMHCWTNNEEINMYLEKVVRVSERLWTCIYWELPIRSKFDPKIRSRRSPESKLVELLAIGMNK